MANDYATLSVDVEWQSDQYSNEKNYMDYNDVSHLETNTLFGLEPVPSYPYPDFKNSGETYQTKNIFEEIEKLKMIHIINGKLTNLEFYQLPEVSYLFKQQWIYQHTIGSRKTSGGHSRKHRNDRGRHELIPHRDEIAATAHDACPCCNVLLDYSYGFNKLSNNHVLGPELYTQLNFARPSIDRIDNNKGYELSNIEIMCTNCNTKKGTS